MRKRGFLILMIALLALIPGSAVAQDQTGDAEGSFILGINSDTYIRPEQSVQTLVVIDEHAVVDGTVTEALFVISGTATVNGALNGDVTVISGTINLSESATVAKDVVLINSDINRTEGSMVGGSVHDRSFAFYDWQLTFLSVLFWIGTTIVILFAGLLFAAIGGRQLNGAGNLISNRPGNVILAALIAGIGLPILAVVAIVTLVGIPVGIAMLIFLLPALWFTGYLVAGTKLGNVILNRREGATEAQHPYLAALLGLTILQFASLIPVLGFMLAWLAGAIGTGAVAYYAWRAWRGAGTTEGPATTLTTQPAPAV